MKWVMHVPYLGEGEVYIEFWWGKLRERGHLEYPNIDERILLRWLLIL
jgi:hypothetical protein